MEESMAAASIEELLESQMATQELIMRISTNFHKLGQARKTSTAARSRLLLLKGYWTTFQENHARICAGMDKEVRQTNEYFSNNVFLTVSDLVEEVTDMLNDWLEKAQPRTAPLVLDASGKDFETKTVPIKLPRIDLPKFSGELTNWENFRDVFESLVASRPELSNVQKLHYLKANLTGEAGRILSTTNVTDANYLAAWELIKRRYDNPRAIVNAHLQTLVEIPNAKPHSVQDLKAIRDGTGEIRTALLNLNRPVDSWEDLFVFITVSKLDKITRQDWELSLGENVELPSYSKLDSFLTSRIRALEAINPSHNLGINNKASNVKSHQVSANRSCLSCKGDHFLHQCKKFLNQTIEQRFQFVRSNKCCFNCLRKGHIPRDCKSKHVCALCKRKHHTLIHSESYSTDTSGKTLTTGGHAGPAALSDSNSEQNKAAPVEVSNNYANKSIDNSIESILLPTALVLIKSSFGRSVRVRALLDQGSQASFITESVVQLIKADRKPAAVNISGIGGAQAGIAKSIASFTVAPGFVEGPTLAISALVMHKLTSYVPRTASSVNDYSHLKNLPLADPEISIKRPIDLIIGADYYGLLLRDGLIRGPSGYPSAQLTIFGWILSGQLHCPNVGTSHLTVHHIQTDDCLNESLRSFWELEEIPNLPLSSEEDLRCEAHFVKTHYRQPSGRYVVRLPFKSDVPISIGETENIAKRIFLSNENRLLRQADLSRAYSDFMLEYENLHHMEKVGSNYNKNTQIVYLPHHPVFKKSDHTSKIRIVFNASRASSNNSSLNDHLMIGPKLQADLFALILKWRSYKYVYTTDIEKMFRQIKMHPSDVDYQRILWRDSPNSVLNSFRLLTVTYGTAPAPFLANRVLKQLARDEANRFPLAAPVLENEVYVDDVMFGAENIILLRQTRDQVTQMLMAGGFKSHKWASNEPRLMEDIPESEQALSVNKTIDNTSSLKILGISWNPSEDAFRIQIRPENSDNFTKRSFLSMVARIFDPMGWVAPVTVTAKIIMQLLWLNKVEWDAPLTGDLLSRCLSFTNELTELSKVTIPRWTRQGEEPQGIELHGFSDASNVAFSAVVFLRVESLVGYRQVSLLYAKTKVAPLKVLSVPRLELCAAVLLTRSIDFVKRAMKLDDVPIYCWTDSSVVLAWLSATPSRWKTFIANRVSEIHSTLPCATWRHVSTSVNPADCASRGIPACELLQHSLWWQGPPWLLSPSTEWPVSQAHLDSKLDLEQRNESHALLSLDCDQEFTWPLPFEISTWPKLLRITAYVRRFTFNARGTAIRISNKWLRAEEISQAKHFWIKKAQELKFSKELALLRNDLPLKGKSAILSLNPYLDAEGILRVGGRLRRANLAEAIKYPVILPKGRIAELIIRHVHVSVLHGGLQLTLRTLRQHYWILHARNSVKNCIRKCVTCVRQRAALSFQRMGDLPEQRITPSRPFAHSGLDYAGPFNIRSSKGRGQKCHKAYCALFICLSTRAIHLEVVDDYTTQSFLAAFDRFTARRGLPAAIYSDNGTNFKGADKELRNQFRAVIRNPELQNYFASDEIMWRFIPPAAPQFGGLWEAGVKSVKFHLKRILGEFTPTFEEFTTLLCKIECSLNSRPIAPLFDDVESFDALTPGHFLVGANLKSVPAPSVLDLTLNRSTRWQAIQQMHERFWKVWSSDYLNTLQQRKKWRTAQPNLKIGDLVLLRSPNLPPTKWEMGRVTECHAGEDKLVRVVSIKTARSSFKRPITQLCPLPVESLEHPSI